MFVCKEAQIRECHTRLHAATLLRSFIVFWLMMPNRHTVSMLFLLHPTHLMVDNLQLYINRARIHLFHLNKKCAEQGEGLSSLQMVERREKSL